MHFLNPFRFFFIGLLLFLPCSAHTIDTFTLRHVLQKHPTDNHLRRLDYTGKTLLMEQAKQPSLNKETYMVDFPTRFISQYKPNNPTDSASLQISLLSIKAFAKLSYNAYLEPTQKDWIKLNKTTLRGSFGWKKDSLRGHVFGNRDNTTFIISLKGTSGQYIPGNKETAKRDKLNDNLLFSCCCARVDISWSTCCNCYLKSNQCSLPCLEKSVITDDIYFYIAQQILFEVQEMYPLAKIWLTGHSLGGSMCSLLALAFNIPCVAFEAPGEMLAAKRMHLPMGPALKLDQMNIWHIAHNADPIYMGTCQGMLSTCYIGGYAMETKCHLGKNIVFDTMKSMNLSQDIRNHKMGFVLESVILPAKEIPKYRLDSNCTDCPQWHYLD